MNPELLRAESLAGPGFSGTYFQLAPGQWLRLADGPHHAGSALVDALFGIGPVRAGEVFWSGVPISSRTGAQRLDIAARAAFVHPRGGLLLNLRVWENILLPIKHRQARFHLDELEAEILATFAGAGISETHASRILGARTDDLAPHEILFALLIRAYCEKPALIICETAFDALPRHALDTAARLLEATAARCPGLALLTIGDTTPTLDRMALPAWPTPETRTWKSSSWPAT